MRKCCAVRKKLVCDQKVQEPEPDFEDDQEEEDYQEDETLDLGSVPSDIFRHLQDIEIEGEKTFESDTNSLNVKLDNVSRSSVKPVLIKKPPILTRHKRKPKPKPRVRIPTNVEKVFAGKYLVKEHYFTAGANITEENKRDLLTEQSPFKYPQDLEEFAYKILTKSWTDKIARKELTLKYNERNGYRSRQQLDRLNRLFVEEPTFKGMVTVLDFDPQYFNTVANRPINKSFKLNDYVQNLRDVFRTKIMIGYKLDEMYLIDENLKEEERVIDEIRKEFKVYIAKFEEFLQDDYSNSIEALRKAELEEAKTQSMYYEYVELSKELSSVTSMIYRLEERWRLLKLYQKCLYLASPLSWRLKHDFYLKMEMGGAGSDVFAKFKLTTTEMSSLHKLIQNFNDGTSIQKEPALYFQEPKQLWQVFRFMEIQNLNSLLHCEELENPVESARVQMDVITKKFDQNLVELQDLVKSLAGGILWEEERATLLEELARELIGGKYREFTIDDAILDLEVFVEDVFELHIGINDANLPPIDMMKKVEMKYNNLILQLDQLPHNIVYKAEMNCYKEEERTMKVAVEAAKKVVQIERMMNNLYKLLDPIPVKYQKELKWRSAPPDAAKVVIPPPEPPTIEEIEEMIFFNDVCEADVEELLTQNK